VQGNDENEQSKLTHLYMNQNQWRSQQQEHATAAGFVVLWDQH